jgi:hypothetical protein
MMASIMVYTAHNYYLHVPKEVVNVVMFGQRNYSNANENAL